MRFGRLTVVKRVEDYIEPSSGRHRARWLCDCVCGNQAVVLDCNLTKKKGTKSCGCFARENMSKVKKRYNTYDLSGEYGVGYTLKGEKFYFDLEDYDKIKNYCWSLTNDGYVSTHIKKKQTLFHKLIMNNEVGIIDHINHNVQDNRKSNLRIVTSSQNGMNASLSKNNTSGVTGVKWHKKQQKWVATITINYKRIWLGSFVDFDDAVKARKKAEEEYYGEFSYDNSQNYTINNERIDNYYEQKSD